MIRKLFWTILLLAGVCVATSLLDRRRAEQRRLFGKVIATPAARSRPHRSVRSGIVWVVAALVILVLVMAIVQNTGAGSHSSGGGGWGGGVGRPVYGGGGGGVGK